MFGLFTDAEEYKQRKKTPFKPPKITIAEIHKAIPQHLFKKSTPKALMYVARDASISFALYKLAVYMDNMPPIPTSNPTVAQFLPIVTKLVFWPLYWFFQGLAFAGFWCLSHEAGHGSLSSYNWINHLIGYPLHTFLMVPYYSWRATHKAHHNATSSIERDENFVPRTRSDYNLPPENEAVPLDYAEIFEDTPIFVLGRMLCMQLFGWQTYLLRNTLGSPMYPPGTNHFNPKSPLFKEHQYNHIVISDIGLVAMATILATYIKHVGFATFTNIYFIPYLLANHWIVMLTFLHHTDPTLPHYRKSEWTWLRGALATVDRPLLGYLGRFFLHNVSHDHIAHHLFSHIPFYNQPQVTEILKVLLRDEYNYDSSNTFRALYRSFTECCFIEDNGDVVFYKNIEGRSQRDLADVVPSKN